MNELDFYDCVELSTIKLGDRIGVLNNTKIISISGTEYIKIYTINYKGEIIKNIKSYNLKTKVQNLDYFYFIRNREERMEKAMRKELNAFILGEAC